MSEKKEKDALQRQWLGLPQALQKSLLEVGVAPWMLKKDSPKATDVPYTRHGVPSLLMEAQLPGLATEGAAVRGTKSELSNPTAILYDPDTQLPQKYLRAHEMEHALANQGRGRGSALNGMWDELTRGDQGAARGEMVKRLLAAAPHLVKEYGLDEPATKTGYFSPTVAQRPDMKNFLYEMLADLSALEQTSGKQLTEDPYMREHVFKTPAERETYNALTGLRQTRLDARDLPPYTRQPEKSGSSGVMDLLRSLVSK